MAGLAMTVAALNDGAGVDLTPSAQLLALVAEADTRAEGVAERARAVLRSAHRAQWRGVATGSDGAAELRGVTARHLLAQPLVSAHRNLHQESREGKALMPANRAATESGPQLLFCTA
jgi:hypothetical protein